MSILHIFHEQIDCNIRVDDKKNEFIAVIKPHKIDEYIDVLATFFDDVAQKPLALPCTIEDQGQAWCLNDAKLIHMSFSDLDKSGMECELRFSFESINNE